MMRLRQLRFNPLADRCRVAATFALLLTLLMAGGQGSAADEGDAAREADAVPAVRVGLLTYGEVAEGEAAQGEGASCFSAGFLATVARETGSAVHRELVPVAMDSEAIFAFPFLVLTGHGELTLSAAERENLAAYLERGGFLLASASCSDRAWAERFATLMGELFEQPMQPIGSEHPVFHSLYDIDRVQSRQPGVEAVLHGLSLGDTLRVVFSPTGLNDTDSAGGGCCCCGGNEVRNARLINANLLVYALTH